MKDHLTKEHDVASENVRQFMARVQLVSGGQLKYSAILLGKLEKKPSDQSINPTKSKKSSKFQRLLRTVRGRDVRIRIVPLDLAEIEEQGKVAQRKGCSDEASHTLRKG
jgi:hypothetical protein